MATIMDRSAINVNVSVDDFDSILEYIPDQAPWTTPDPWNDPIDLKTTPWRTGTYHRTEQVGAAVALNFTGPALYIYGGTGPEYGSFEVDIDGNKTVVSAYRQESSLLPTSEILFTNEDLAYAEHTLTLTNKGAQDDDKGGNAFLFDYLDMTVQMAPKGASISNKTIEEDDPSLTYEGIWGTNQSGNFSGGGSTYTNGDKASFTVEFQASAIYIFGDKKNDHRTYNVYLDDGPAQTFNGTSGCGGDWGGACEQQQPTIKYFASNLNGSTHTLKLENIAGVNESYFDLDSIVLTVPSEYAPRNLSESSTSSNGSTSTGQTGSGSSGSDTPDGAFPLHASPLLFLAFLVLYMLQPRLRQ